jgi:outer membrane receptor protein involved in Fe transport
MKRLLAVASLTLFLAITGCAAAAGPGDGAPRRQGKRISAEEIQQAQTQNSYDMIRSLRPAWLQRRGQQSLTNPGAGQVVVYLDGTRLGGAEALRQIPALDVESAQYLSGTEAGSRFGLDHTGGAILITTRRR